MTMMRLAAVTVGLVLLSGAAFAQDFTAEQRAACRGDYNKFCQGTRPGGGRVLACLNKQHAKLSAECRKVVDAQKK